MNRNRPTNEPTGTKWLLNQIHWQFFVTIGLPHQKGIATRSRSIWGGFRGRLAKALNANPQRLIWVATLEWGKSRENPHLHALISGLPRDLQPDAVIQSMASIGQLMKTPDIVAMAYSQRLGAVAYILKELDQPNLKRSSEDGSWPMISDSVWKVLRRHPNMRSGSPSKVCADA